MTVPRPLLVARYRVVGAAAGGLHSSAADLSVLLAAYAAHGSPVLSRASFEQMIMPAAAVTLEGAEGAEYGLGHGVHRSPEGHTVAYHSGSNPGYVAYLIVDVDAGEGLVVLANGDAAVPVLIAVVEAWGERTGVSLPPLY